MGFGARKQFASATIENTRFLYPYFFGGISVNQNPVSGRVFLQAIQVPRQLTVDQFLIPILNSGTGNYRGCLYADNGDTPVGGKLTIDTGDVASAANSLDPVGTLSVSPVVSLKPGLYWIGYQTSVVGASMRTDGSGSSSNLLPAIFNGCFYDNPGGYGAPQDPCPAVTNLSSQCVYQYLRVLSVP